MAADPAAAARSVGHPGGVLCLGGPPAPTPVALAERRADVTVIDALFFANLADLAVNEAMRLPAERLSTGGYVRLLDRLFERRHRLVLRRLLAIDGDPTGDPPVAAR